MGRNLCQSFFRDTGTLACVASILEQPCRILVGGRRPLALMLRDTFLIIVVGSLSCLESLLHDAVKRHVEVPGLVGFILGMGERLAKPSVQDGVDGFVTFVAMVHEMILPKRMSPLMALMIRITIGG